MAATSRLYRVQAFTGTPAAIPAKVNLRQVLVGGSAPLPAKVYLRSIVVSGVAPAAAVTANAGPDQTGVEPYSIVTLDGSQSKVTSGPATYAWVQTAGPSVVIDSPDQPSTTFTAPGSLTEATVTFQLTVTDSASNAAVDLVSVVVLPVTDTVVLGMAEQPVQWVTV